MIAGYCLEKYFSPYEHTIYSFNLENTPYWTNWNNRLPFYIPKGFPISIQSVEKLKQVKFDLVMECDGAGQFHLTGMKKMHIPTIYWSIDVHLKVKRQFQLHIKDDFTRIYTSQKDYVGAFAKKDCYWLPLACDPSLHRKIDCQKIYDVVFVGNLDPLQYSERLRLLNRLSKRFRVGIFQNRFGEEMIIILNQGKIVFNKSLNGDLNLRVFEALSCGSFLVTDRIKNGLLDLFTEKEHLVTYGDEWELEDLISYYLIHEEEREEIARAGQKEVHENHTFYHRAKTILEKGRV